MNTYAKGYRHEAKTVEWFRQIGYDCERIQKSGQRRSGAQDAFGIDGIAVKDGRAIFWQCKANKAHLAEAVRRLWQGREDAFQTDTLHRKADPDLQKAIRAIEVQRRRR